MNYLDKISKIYIAINIKSKIYIVINMKNVQAFMYL